MLTVIIEDADVILDISLNGASTASVNVDISQQAAIQINAYPSTNVNITTPGPQGIPGPAGSSSSSTETRYVQYHQTTPSALWIVTHDLTNPYPDVRVIDSYGEEMYPNVTYVDAHTVEIEFGFAETGVVQLG